MEIYLPSGVDGEADNTAEELADKDALERGSAYEGGSDGCGSACGLDGMVMKPLER